MIGKEELRGEERAGEREKEGEQRNGGASREPRSSIARELALTNRGSKTSQEFPELTRVTPLTIYITSDYFTKPAGSFRSQKSLDPVVILLFRFFFSFQQGVIWF
jgi:hypothetical protein